MYIELDLIGEIRTPMVKRLKLLVISKSFFNL